PAQSSELSPKSADNELDCRALSRLRPTPRIWATSDSRSAHVLSAGFRQFAPFVDRRCPPVCGACLAGARTVALLQPLVDFVAEVVDEAGSAAMGRRAFPLHTPFGQGRAAHP